MFMLVTLFKNLKKILSLCFVLLLKYFLLIFIIYLILILIYTDITIFDMICEVLRFFYPLYLKVADLLPYYYSILAKSLSGMYQIDIPPQILDAIIPSKINFTFISKYSGIFDEGQLKPIYGFNFERILIILKAALPEPNDPRIWILLLGLVLYFIFKYYIKRRFKK